jgi:hypothetical protein
MVANLQSRRERAWGVRCDGGPVEGNTWVSLCSGNVDLLDTGGLRCWHAVASFSTVARSDGLMGWHHRRTAAH